MTSPRWDAAVQIFEQALQQPPERRDEFVIAAAGGDQTLYDSVRRLLDADASVHPLLGMTPVDLATLMRPPEAPWLTGRRFGAYLLGEAIGRGGMATVYEAHDAKHQRSVAIKVLDAAASSALGGQRFRREIETLARLQHPHILPLYDSGESDGLLYFVMPLADGTLREQIARGPLPLADVRRIAHAIATALDYAHRRGLVHRDVKPANVLITEEHVALADFGIAQKAAIDAADRLTGTGIFVGTPAYMSPEHAAGDAQLSPASDQYAFACVVFEMLTGAAPYQDDSARALLAKHMHHPVPSPRLLRPDLPAAVDTVFRRALAKSPADRFPTVTEFAQSLDDALRGVAVPPSASLGRRRWLTAGFAALGIVAVAWYALTTPPRVHSTSIAVLPFVNMSGDSANEYFSDGVTEELTGALAQLGALQVTPRTTAFAYKGRSGDIRTLGRELGVQHIMEGSVRRDGDRVLFVATLYDARSGDRLWHNRYERAWSTMLALQTEIASTIAEQLRLRLLPEQQSRLAGRHSDNAEAYDNYLKGRYFFGVRTAASLTSALEHFQHAVALDSSYARAYAGLADTYSIMAWTGAGAPTDLFSLAEQAAQRALMLDSTIAETFVSLGVINTFHTWDWAAAERATRRALALDSTSAAAWFFHTWHLVAQGRVQEALTVLQRARQLEPFSLITNARVGTLLTWNRRYAEAESTLRATLQLEPTYPVARVQLARVLSALGKHDEAIAALPPDSVRFGSYEAGIAGYVYARAGRRDQALHVARALERRNSVPAEGVAAIYAALNDRAAALTWLERAVDARGVGLVFLAAEPMYDDLRQEPRYLRVVQQIGLARSPR
jgi:eukaryotic-like serine/threonine-protein kinase